MRKQLAVNDIPRVWFKYVTEDPLSSLPPTLLSKHLWCFEWREWKKDIRTSGTHLADYCWNVIRLQTKNKKTETLQQIGVCVYLETKS